MGTSSILDFADLILEHLVRGHFMFILQFLCRLDACCWDTILEPIPWSRNRSIW
jgi:hypothetical protein